MWVRAQKMGRGSWACARALVAAAAVAVVAGCAGGRGGDPFSEIFEEREITPSLLQSRLMALGDELIARVSSKAEMIDRGTDDIATRRLAHTLKLVTAEATIANVATPNPLVGLLDMVVMTTLMRSRVESLAPREMPEFADSIVVAFERSEQSAWALAGEFLSEEQLADLSRAINTWNLQNQDVRFVSRIRLSEFANERLQTPSGAKPTASLPSSVLDLFFLDPLSGLDPAIQEIEEARLLAERISYQAQRMPRLIRWETEALYYDLVTNPEIEELAASLMEALDGVGRVGRLADEFPQVIETEREAAVDQLTSSFFTQGRDFLRSLEGSQEPLQQTLASFESAATAGTSLADELNELAGESRRLADQLDLGEESSASDSSEAMTAESFERSTTQVEQAANEVTRLLREANELADQPVLDSPDYLAQMTEDTSDVFLDEVLETGLYLIGAGALALFLAVSGALAIHSRRVSRAGEARTYGWTH